MQQAQKVFEDKLAESKKLYGSDVVAEVTMFVELSDADGAYVHFEDNGMFEHAECVEFLYFEND